MRTVHQPGRAALWALLGGLLAAVALLGVDAGVAGGGQVASAAPAQACAKDTRAKIGDGLRYNNYVFVGTVTDTTRTRGGRILLVDTTVESIRKGNAKALPDDGTRVEVFPIADRKAYVSLPRVGATYVFFARKARVGIAASPCGGYQRATPEVLALLDKIRPEASDPETPTATLSEPADGTPGPPAPVAQIIAPGLALAVVGGLGLLVVGVTGRKP